MDRPILDAARLISPQDDRRAFQRFALNILVFVRLTDAPQASLCDSAAAPAEALYALQPVAVKDLSMTGVFFFSRLAYPLEADVEICLCLDGTEFLTPAVVRRRVRVDNQLCGYGVSFRQSQTSKVFRVALAAFLLRQDARVR